MVRLNAMVQSGKLRSSIGPACFTATSVCCEAWKIRYSNTARSLSRYCTNVPDSSEPRRS